MTKIIAINGPPRSGKDTLAWMIRQSILASGISCNNVSMAEPIYNSLNLEYLYGDITIDEMKKDPTFRSVITSFAELCIKPNFGESFYVNRAIKRINANGSVITIVPDLGFDVELEHLNKHFDVTIIRLEREGTSFEDDARKYLGKPRYTIVNNSLTHTSLAIQAHEIIQDYLRKHYNE